MDTRHAPFIFQDSLTDLTRMDDFVAWVPDRITTRDQLFTALQQELGFPSYFGRNWDALYDCLGDLSWIANSRVILAHKAIPNLDAIALGVYFHVLADCVTDWKPGEQHELLVVFPQHARTEVCRIIEQSSPSP